jgi:hypothetical protein
MTAPVRLERYTDRKSHACGCITVWDTTGGGPRYEHACGAHRGHARRYQADSPIEGVNNGPSQERNR